MLNPNNPPQPSYQTFNNGNAPALPPDWKKGLFSCCDDMELCCFTWCCHCFQYAKLAEKLQLGSYWSNCLIYTGIQICLTPCFPIFMGKFREDMRTKYNLPGSFLEDCCTRISAAIAAP